MTCLEHLIENCLCKFEDGKPYEEIEKAIENDINLADSGITAGQCFEICLYVWGTFLPYGGYEKINDGDIIIHKDEKKRTDEEIKWLVEHQEQTNEIYKIFIDAKEISQLETIIDRHFRSDDYKTRNILDLVNEVAKDIINTGYRKEKEVAKEILQPIYELCKVRKEITFDDLNFLIMKYGIELE